MDRTSRPLPFAIGLALFAAAALLLVEWPRIRTWYHPPRSDLPAPERIAQMRAAVWAAGSRGNLESDVPWIELPVSVARRIWRRFEPSEFVSRPPVNPDLPLGELVATTDDGHVTRLWFFEAGPDELVFTTDGERFFRSEPRDDLGGPLGGGLLLAGTLRHAAGLAEPPGPGPDQPDNLSIK
jgi:hypothetical protein